MDAATPKGAGTRQAGLAADILPGLTTAAVVVPKALAYATIAQLPVQAGLLSPLERLGIWPTLVRRELVEGKVNVEIEST